ncbi:MAG TPA: hypothetical protein VF072_03450 [Thermoleophilaceae bacterium]
MARSARHAAVVAMTALLALAGCDSTQNKNARAKLKAAREIAGRKPLRVTEPNPDVRVTSTAVVRGRRSSAVVVRLRNSAPRPFTDVPISIAARGPGGRTVRLNTRRGVDWFQTHVPAVPPAGEATWVLTTRRRLPRRARVVARVGVAASPPISRATSLPELDASPEGGVRRGAITVRVDNPSDVPQYGLQVYALAVEHGRYVAAGTAALEHLGTGQAKTVAVRLTGRPTGGRLQLSVLPATFE